MKTCSCGHNLPKDRKHLPGCPDRGYPDTFAPLAGVKSLSDLVGHLPTFELGRLGVLKTVRQEQALTRPSLPTPRIFKKSHLDRLREDLEWSERAGKQLNVTRKNIE